MWCRGKYTVSVGLGMRLREYRESVSKTRAAAAGEIGTAVETMRRYELPPGHPSAAIPAREIMRRIYVWSAGTVTPNDFYDLPVLEQAA